MQNVSLPRIFFQDRVHQDLVPLTYEMRIFILGGRAETNTLRLLVAASGRVGGRGWWPMGAASGLSPCPRGLGGTPAPGAGKLS